MLWTVCTNNNWESLDEEEEKKFGKVFVLNNSVVNGSVYILEKTIKIFSLKNFKNLRP
jgi:hypothetical protein